MEPKGDPSTRWLVDSLRVTLRLGGLWTRSGYNFPMRVLVAIPLAIALVGPLPAARAAAHARQTAAAATLHELRETNDLKARFNDDRGKTRIVLLVSPT